MFKRYVLTLALCVATVLPSSADRRKTVVDDGYVLKVRGVMEAYPSIADDFEARMEFYARSGMTHYFYCPSDDRYCNRWGWKFIYNDADRSALRDFMAMCRRHGLEFVWTLNPSDSFTWSREDYDFLLNKLIIMYYNGIRSFAVCLNEDERTGQLKGLLQQDFVARMKEEVSLYMIGEMPVVTYPTESDVARILMKGYHLNEEFRRKAYAAGSILCLMTANDSFRGIPVSATIDYARDPETYQADRSIVESMDMMDDEVKDAFMTFLRHTGGDEESAGVRTFTLETWEEDAAEALYREFDKIEKVPAKIKKAAAAPVIEALSPWLYEFGRLGTRGKRTIECLRFYKTDDIGRFWLSYVENVMTDEDRVSYGCYPVGEEKLQPFCEDMMSQMIGAFAAKLTSGASERNLASTLYQAPNAALDSDFHTYAPSGGYIAFPIPADANTCRLLTGPLSENGTVLFRQIGTDGELVAEFVVRSPYTEFDLKEGAVKVDVLGDVDIYESIFVYL